MMKRFAIGTLCLATVLTVGCGVSKPKRVEAPSLNPDAAASKAIEMYDTNKNGKIDGKEFDATPSLKYALSYLDKDGDKMLSAGEIANQMKLWVESKVGLITPAFRFNTKGGKGLKSGMLTLTPEPFLGDGIKPGKGNILNGSCTPSSEGNQEGLPGMSYGFYTITIDSMSGKKWGVEISNNNEISRKSSGNYIIDLK